MEDEETELGKSWKLLVSRELTFPPGALALAHPRAVKADSSLFTSLPGVCLRGAAFVFLERRN